jgi:DNA-binding transcriptional ArsR family regulator
VPRTRPPRPSLPEAADLFRLLADPGRLRLLLLLAARGEVSVGELADTLGRHLSTTGNQLMLLHRGRVVGRRREGRKILYRISSPFVAEVLRRVCED